MDDIDTEVFISLVEAKPVLWDKTTDIYKDRIATRKAWEEVCVALKPEFETNSETEKNAFGKEVIKRWTNLRDYYAKSKRDEKAGKKSGSEAKKRKKYVFAEQLQFLNKIYQVSNTVDSLDSEMETEEVQHTSKDDEEMVVSTQPRKRKSKQPDEVELQILKALQPTAPCSKMAFLHSLMPHLQNLSDVDFLQFQMRVLQVIDDLNQRRGSAVHHTNTSYSSMPAYQPHHLTQPPIFQNHIVQPQQTSFAPQCFPVTSINIPGNINQHQTLPQAMHGLHTSQSTTTLQRPNTQTTTYPQPSKTASELLRGFCYSDSSQSENQTSPVVSPSGDDSDIF